MNDIVKEELFSRWSLCDRETMIRLISEYLIVMNLGDGQLGWLRFLQSSLFQEEILDHICTIGKHGSQHDVSF